MLVKKGFVNQKEFAIGRSVLRFVYFTYLSLHKIRTYIPTYVRYISNVFFFCAVELDNIEGFFFFLSFFQIILKHIRIVAKHEKGRNRPSQEIPRRGIIRKRYCALLRLWDRLAGRTRKAVLGDDSTPLIINNVAVATFGSKVLNFNPPQRYFRFLAVRVEKKNENKISSPETNVCVRAFVCSTTAVKIFLLYLGTYLINYSLM